MTYTLDLAVREGNACGQKEGYIVLKRCGKYKVPFGPAKAPRLMDVLSLGPCLSKKEVKHQADRLIAELKEIKKRAVRRL